jgi:hypothetical protein
MEMDDPPMLFVPRNQNQILKTIETILNMETPT